MPDTLRRQHIGVAAETTTVDATEGSNFHAGNGLRAVPEIGAAAETTGVSNVPDAGSGSSRDDSLDKGPVNDANLGRPDQQPPRARRKKRKKIVRVITPEQWENIGLPIPLL